ncbi:EAL domain-containing protein (putative c-di-GMP-specific phosphodiesterase class I) [Crenobacter luteus]|uniref:EAL domain-containing protein n=1 Tax=Crenobacter luteus TaxID=1452487 RepID=UPI0010D08A36|nr:EAL domain-containing protein [Crenobacter luteus]TCP11603.1 EAL domain-containing protein (putative c-di-GMP-specific phosphodiesterase class I) [Crenobacter luteus]
MPTSPVTAIRADTLLDLIENRRVGVEYQVILDARTLEPFGYEGLARLYDRDGAPLPPQAVFDCLHASPLSLVQLELIAKTAQIEHAPADGKLFVNVDPDALLLGLAPNRDHPMFRLLARRADVVVEIIENSNTQQADRSLALARALAEAGIQTALDDIGAPASLLALPLLMSVDYYKFDRHWLGRRDDAAHRALLSHLLGFARERGKATVLEGVETAGDLELARALGVDYVQGFLFRERFVSVRP